MRPQQIKDKVKGAVDDSETLVVSIPCEPALQVKDVKQLTKELEAAITAVVVTYQRRTGFRVLELASGDAGWIVNVKV